jgi:hypothetical protein
MDGFLANFAALWDDARYFPSSGLSVSIPDSRITLDVHLIRSLNHSVNTIVTG